MTRLFVTLALLLAAGGCGDGKTAPSDPKPDLHLITSLPLLFGETFGLDSRQRAIIPFLEERYRLVAIDLPSQAPVNATLLMVQPRALPAEELVHLDKWVRAGGRLVLLADPRLEWPSERPLGDPLRPPPMFADTGLLLHWGLRLDAPDKAGPVEIPWGDLRVARPVRRTRRLRHRLRRDCRALQVGHGTRDDCRRCRLARRRARQTQRRFVRISATGVRGLAS